MTTSQQGRANPYVGPRPFQPGERLYGRNNDVARLRDLLIAERIVLLYSPSGAGKTSLTQAALVPALVREDFRVLPLIRVGADPGAGAGAPAPAPAGDDVFLDMLLGATPARAPNRYVRSTLLSLAGDAQRLAPNATLASYLGQRDQTVAAQGTVLIFDQFEEIITADPTDRPAKEEFFAQVGEVLRDRNIWALFALREEFVPSLDPFQQFVPTRFRSTFRLNLLDAVAARPAIIGPPRLLDVTFTDAAATRLINDLRRVRVQQPDGTTAEQLGQFVEPVQLQVVCHRIWERHIAASPGGQASTIDERAIGGVSDVNTALAEYYAEQVARAAAETGVPERVIRAWFDHDLITEQGLRGQVLQQIASRGALSEDALRHLVNAHLVRAEPRGGATWLELTHDRLVEPIRADNARWHEANLSTFQRQAILWERAGRPNELLLRGAALDEAEAWLRENPAQTEVERAFLERCREAAAAERRARRANLFIRWLAAVVAILAVASLTLAWSANRNRARAVSEASRAQTAQAVAQTSEVRAIAERDKAEESERRSRHDQAQLLAEQSLAKLKSDPAEGLRLAIAAASRDDRRALAPTGASAKEMVAPPDPAVESALRAAIAPAFSSTFTQTNGVLAVALSADGSQIATLDHNGLIIAWPVLTPTERLVSDPPAVVTAAPLRSAALTADGRRAMAVSVTGDLFVWEASGALQQLASETVASAAMSTDGRFLAVGGVDGTVELRDLDGHTLLSRNWHSGPVIDMDISADGQHAASQGADGEIAVWSVGESDPTMFSRPMNTFALALSANGDRIVLGGAGGTLLWDADKGVLWTSRIFANAGAFTPDERRVVVALLNGLVVLDTGSGKVIGWLPNEGNARATVNAIAVSENGQRVTGAVLESDGQGRGVAVPGGARLWTLGLPTMFVHEGVAQSVAFSPDSRLLVTAGDDGAVYVWDAETGALEQELRRDDEAIKSAQFSPDGARIVTAHEGGAACIWNAKTGTLERTLPAGEGILYSAQFSPDGARIVTASEDRTVRVWDAATGTETLTLRGHTRAVHSAQFSPDGARIVTASEDRTVRLWDAASGDSLRVFPGTLDGVWRAAFDPQGEHIVVATGGSTVRVWDAGSGEELRALGAAETDHMQTVVDAVFSPDGQRVATASWDGKARLWNVGAPDAPAPSAVVLAEYQDAVTGVAFSPDGRLIATCAVDGSVRLHYADFELVLAEARGRARLLERRTAAP